MPCPVVPGACPHARRPHLAALHGHLARFQFVSTDLSAVLYFHLVDLIGHPDHATHLGGTRVFAGLKARSDQAAGLRLDRHGKVYICSER